MGTSGWIATRSCSYLVACTSVPGMCDVDPYFHSDHDPWSLTDLSLMHLYNPMQPMHDMYHLLKRAVRPKSKMPVPDNGIEGRHQSSLQ